MNLLYTKYNYKKIVRVNLYFTESWGCKSVRTAILGGENCILPVFWFSFPSFFVGKTQRQVVVLGWQFFPSVLVIKEGESSWECIQCKKRLIVLGVRLWAQQHQDASQLSPKMVVFCNNRVLLQVEEIWVSYLVDLVDPIARIQTFLG